VHLLCTRNAASLITPFWWWARWEEWWWVAIAIRPSLAWHGRLLVKRECQKQPRNPGAAPHTRWRHYFNPKKLATGLAHADFTWPLLSQKSDDWWGALTGTPILSTFDLSLPYLRDSAKMVTYQRSKDHSVMCGFWANGGPSFWFWENPDVQIRTKKCIT
jgi:hypothetical protein